MLTDKKYICPLCKTIITTSTNHEGEIYTNCKVCDSMVLYCGELSALQNLISRPFVQARLVYYYYNLEEKEDAKSYDELCQRLVRANYKKFSSFAKHEYLKRIYFFNFQSIKLYSDSFITAQQWATNIGRLHSWYEGVVQNIRIKKGYYLQLGVGDVHCKFSESFWLNIIEKELSNG